MRTELEKYARVYAEVNLDAVRSNVERMKANIDKDVLITAVIKTDGYGHGAVALAHELEPISYVWGFATATTEEAKTLRNAGIKKPILILGYTFPYCYQELVEMDIRPVVFSVKTAKQLSEAAVRLGKTMKVHIKVDTGMSRIGIRPDDSGIEIIKGIKACQNLEIEGILTHFAKADETDKTETRQQFVRFDNFVKQAEKECAIHIPIKHCSNSAGIIELQEMNMDMVRAGIILYGLWPSDEVAQNIVELTPAMSLISHIVYVKELEAGSSISYGGTYVTTSKTKVATIPIGYGDGYPRGLSNKGYVLIRGQKAPILGRVCMDQFMVDITHIPDATEGDMVTLIGRDGDVCITMEELGELSGRFNYELACDLGKRIPRVYVRDGKVVSVNEYHE